MKCNLNPNNFATLLILEKVCQRVCRDAWWVQKKCGREKQFVRMYESIERKMESVAVYQELHERMTLPNRQ